MADKERDCYAALVVTIEFNDAPFQQTVETVSDDVAATGVNVIRVAKSWMLLRATSSVDAVEWAGDRMRPKEGWALLLRHPQGEDRTEALTVVMQDGEKIQVPSPTDPPPSIGPIIC